MTAPSTDPSAIARTRKRLDTQPKSRPKAGNEATRDPSRVRTYMDTSAKGNAELIDPNKPLTQKQKLFIKYWAEGMAIQPAAAKAGYSSPSMVYRLVRMPNVLKLYNEEKRLYEEACQMSRKKVMDGLMEAIDMARTMAEPATMVSGWREIGKMCGYYEPIQKRVEVSISGNIIHERLNRLSDEQLLKLIQSGAQEPDARHLEVLEQQALETVEDVAAQAALDELEEDEEDDEEEAGG